MLYASVDRVKRYGCGVRYVVGGKGSHTPTRLLLHVWRWCVWQNTKNTAVGQSFIRQPAVRKSAQQGRKNVTLTSTFNRVCIQERGDNLSPLKKRRPSYQLIQPPKPTIDRATPSATIKETKHYFNFFSTIDSLPYCIIAPETTKQKRNKQSVYCTILQMIQQTTGICPCAPALQRREKKKKNATAATGKKPTSTAATTTADGRVSPFLRYRGAAESAKKNTLKIYIRSIETTATRPYPCFVRHTVNKS